MVNAVKATILPILFVLFIEYSFLRTKVVKKNNIRFSAQKFSSIFLLLTKPQYFEVQKQKGKY